MYPYHNRIKQRINNGELTGFEFVDSYKFNDGKQNALLLYFRTEPYVKPIRERSFHKYEYLTKS